MAARRVSLGYILTAAALSLAAAAATFHLKYAVRDLERDLARARSRIDADERAVRTLRADLAYLTRPDRLVAQAAQAGMVPAAGSRIVDASTLEQWGRLALSATEFETVLPSGTTISMRAKPPTVDLPDVVEKP